MNRRTFLTGSSAVMAAVSFGSPVFGETTKPTLRIVPDRVLCAMPRDFIGFSYESPQLADPTYFSASNDGLVAQFRKLSTCGLLRLGGNLSDLTLWSGGPQQASVSIPERPNSRTRFEWELVGARASENRPASVTPESIRALGSFLKATGWKLIYGLNLGSGTPERAAEEAACVVENAGDNLLAFQAGNEPDLFGRSLRRHGWNFNRYWDEYQNYVRTVRARISQAPFAGPDVAGNTGWIRQFAERAKGDAVMLSSHYYALGPPEKPEMNAQRLLRRDPRAALEVPLRVSRESGMPYRVTEMNSCFHGGKPGVSNAFASALWAADCLLSLAQAGCAGVNLHTGGKGFYAAFVGESPRLTERPLFRGMQFAQRFAGATFIAADLDAGGRNVAAYAARSGQEMLLAVINKDSVPVAVQVSGLSDQVLRIGENWALTAPSLDALTDVRFQPSDTRDSAGTLHIPEYSGRLVALRG